VLFVRLAAAYAAADRLDDAAAVLDHGLAALPGHLDGRVMKARLGLLRRRPGEARAELADVLALQADHWGALHLLAEVHQLTGDREGELEALEHLLRIVPDDVDLAQRRSDLENDDGERPHMPHRPLMEEHVAAKTDPARAPGPQPGVPAAGLRRGLAADPFVNATMAELLAAQGDVEGATEMLRELIARSPERADLRARFVELGGDGADLPPPAAPPAPVPAALEDAMRALVGDPS